jgi:hypothetical protein
VKLDFIPRACPLCGGENFKVLVEATLDEGRLTASAFASRKLPEYMHSRMVEEPGYRQEFGPGISTSSGPANARGGGQRRHGLRGLRQIPPDLCERLEICLTDIFWVEARGD